MLGKRGPAARPPHTCSTCSLCDTYTCARGSKLSAGVYNYHMRKCDMIVASPDPVDKSRLCPLSSPKCTGDHCTGAHAPSDDCISLSKPPQTLHKLGKVNTCPPRCQELECSTYSTFAFDKCHTKWSLREKEYEWVLKLIFSALSMRRQAARLSVLSCEKAIFSFLWHKT